MLILSVESYEGFYSKKDQHYIPCSIAHKLVCVDDKFSKPIVVKEFELCKKVMKITLK